MRQWLKFHFGGWRHERHELDNKFARAIKLIEVQRVLIQNLQKEIAAGVLRSDALQQRVIDVEKDLERHAGRFAALEGPVAGLQQQFGELRKHIASAEPEKLKAIRATSWGNYRKLTGEEDFDVPA